eukprot:scaffold141683_cov35-Tisochrysis_lutea.AAC.1
MVRETPNLVLVCTQIFDPWRYPAGVVLLLTTVLPFILFVGQGVTKMTSGRLELHLAWSGILGSKRHGGS